MDPNLIVAGGFFLAGWGLFMWGLANLLNAVFSLMGGKNAEKQTTD